MQSKADSFSAYLEAKQRARQMGQPEAAPTGGTALSILAVLGKAPQLSMSLSDLQQASGMNFLAFSQACQRLQESGYITIAGEPSQEKATLTKLGLDVASLAG